MLLNTFWHPLHVPHRWACPWKVMIDLILSWNLKLVLYFVVDNVCCWCYKANVHLITCLTWPLTLRSSISFVGWFKQYWERHNSTRQAGRSSLMNGIIGFSHWWCSLVSLSDLGAFLSSNGNPNRSTKTRTWTYRYSIIFCCLPLHHFLLDIQCSH